MNDSEQRPVSPYEIVPRTSDFHFAIGWNGYRFEGNTWKYSGHPRSSLATKFKGQAVSFFGPGTEPESNTFFSASSSIEPTFYLHAFDQQHVLDTIAKYRQIDENQAARIAYLLGGIVRHLAYNQVSYGDSLDILGTVKQAARMTKLAEKRSAYAVVSAMAMYVISNGPVNEDSQFMGRVYHMADAIRYDPVTVGETVDLGLSQVARLRNFEDSEHNKEKRLYPDIVDQLKTFDGFPTVGAEFHFTPDVSITFPNFWQRLALLNMSQYQDGSYIQLSRRDRDVIEIRMNPSIYPVTVANWRHINRILPELKNAYFTLTLNRNDKNFYWNNTHDRDLLIKLRALGLLTYAGGFTNIPQGGSKEEIDFGTVYLGQTVKLHAGNYDFDGLWGGREGSYGQLGVYAGMGSNLPQLSYFLSLALTKPEVLDSLPPDFWSRIKTLKDALDIAPQDGSYIFRSIQKRAMSDKRLRTTHEAGKQILALLEPETDTYSI